MKWFALIFCAVVSFVVAMTAIDKYDERTLSSATSSSRSATASFRGDAPAAVTSLAIRAAGCAFAVAVVHRWCTGAPTPAKPHG